MLTNQNKLNQDLFNAIYWGKREHGKEKEIENLLKQGADVNALNNDRTLLHQAVLIKNIIAVKELLINGADVNIKDCDNMTPLALCVKNNVERQVVTSQSIIYLLLAFGANSSDTIDNNFTLKKYTEEFEALKRDYPHCAKLIEANKNSDLQYNEDTKKLDEEFESIKIKKSDDKVVFSALQDLRQYVLQKSNGTKAISTSESSAIVSTNAETSSKRKMMSNDQIDSSISYKKGKFGNSSNTQPSSILMTPNIPNKQINMLEAMHYWGREMFSQHSFCKTSEQNKLAKEKEIKMIKRIV